MKTSNDIKTVVENAIFKVFIVFICTLISTLLLINSYNERDNLVDKIEVNNKITNDSEIIKCNSVEINDEITENNILETNNEIIEEVYEPIIETTILIEPISYKPDKMPNEYYSYLEYYSDIYDIDIPILMAILISENPEFNPLAEHFNSNGTIDIGLCQVNSKYVDYYADVYDLHNFNPYDANQNINFLASHVRYLLNCANNYGLSGEDALLFMAGAYNRGLSSEKENRNMYHYKEKFLNNYNALITKC